MQKVKVISIIMSLFKAKEKAEEKKEDFQTIILTSILPGIKRMIEREEHHYAYLSSSVNHPSLDNEQRMKVQGYADESKKMLNHYRTRQKEYEDYVLTNKDN